MSSTLRVEKVIASLPDQLESNTLYLVRAGVGIDIYVTDSTGSIAHKHNTPEVDLDTNIDQVNYWDISGDLIETIAQFQIDDSNLISGNNTVGTFNMTDQYSMYTNKTTFTNTSISISLEGTGGLIVYFDTIIYNDSNDLFINMSPAVVLFMITSDPVNGLNIECGQMIDGTTATVSLPPSSSDLTFNIDDENNIYINSHIMRGIKILPYDGISFGILTPINDEFGVGYPSAISYDLTNTLSSIEGTIIPPSKLNSMYICTKNKVYNGVEYRENDIVLVNGTGEISHLNRIPNIYTDIFIKKYSYDSQIMPKPIASDVPEYNYEINSINNLVYPYELTLLNDKTVLEYEGLTESSLIFDLELFYNNFSVDSTIRVCFTQQKYNPYNQIEPSDTLYIDIKRKYDTLEIDFNNMKYSIISSYPSTVFERSYVSLLTLSSDVFNIDMNLDYKTITIAGASLPFEYTGPVNMYCIINRGIQSETNNKLKLYHRVLPTLLLAANTLIREDDIIYNDKLFGTYNNQYINSNTSYISKNNKLIALNQSTISPKKQIDYLKNLIDKKLDIDKYHSSYRGYYNSLTDLSQRPVYNPINGDYILVATAADQYDVYMYETYLTWFKINGSSDANIHAVIDPILGDINTLLNQILGN